MNISADVENLPSPLRALAEFAATTRFEALPRDVVTRTVQILADNIAAIAAGNQLSEMRALIARRARPDGVAVIGTGARAEPSVAALINGAAGTSLELDEGNKFSRGHPGIHVVPTGLAIAEDLGSDSHAFLTALAVGYEVGARIGSAVTLRKHVQPHGTWGTIAAAITAAKLRNFDVEATQKVISVAACLPLASNRNAAFEGGTVRNMYAGVGCQLGFLAADLVACGFEGGTTAVDIVYGRILGEKFARDLIAKDLGGTWLLLKGYFKMHACCRHLHGIVDVVQMLLADHPELQLHPDRIVDIEVATYATAAEMIERTPVNGLAARFSAPFVLATSLINGDATLERFAPAAVADTRIRSLAQKVRVTEDPAMTAMLPSRRPCRLKILLGDGRAVQAETTVNRGDPDAAYSADDLDRKFLSITEPVWGKRAAGLKDAIDGLAAGGSMESLWRSLRL